jgi:hypothetical protein
MTLLGARRTAPGETLEVRGKYWAAECNDVIVCSPGCSGKTCTGGDRSPPVTGIKLLLRPVGDTPGRERVLKEAISADDRFAFHVDVSIPRDVVPGRYVIVPTSATTGESSSRTLRVG